LLSPIFVLLKENMLKIGLTGGIGSGKSTAARIFEALNVPVYYADEASKQLYHTDAELMQEMKQYFGERIYHNGQLDRKQLAEIVFGSPEKLALLNSLVHPPTIRAAEQWMNQQSAPYVIKEAALFFESGSARGLDYIIGVHAPLSLRIKRVMDRDGSSRDQVLQRMEQQIDADLKMKLCDFVLINDEQQLLLPQVLKLHQELLQAAKATFV
jgi:dephospho-CoA kinase